MTEKNHSNEYEKKSFYASHDVVTKYSELLEKKIPVQYGIDLLRLSLQDNILRKNDDFTSKDLVRYSRNFLKPKIERITRLLNTDARIDSFSATKGNKSINPQSIIIFANILTTKFLPQILEQSSSQKDGNDQDPIKDFLNQSDFYFKSEEFGI